MWDFWAGDATAPRDLTSLRTTKWPLNPDHDESAHFQGKKHSLIPDSHPHCQMRSQAHWNQKMHWNRSNESSTHPMMFPQSSLLGTQDGDKNPNYECWYLCKHQIPKAVANVQMLLCVCVCVWECMLHGFDNLQMTQKLQVKYLMLIWYWDLNLLSLSSIILTQGK